MADARFYLGTVCITAQSLSQKSWQHQIKNDNNPEGKLTTNDTASLQKYFEYTMHDVNIKYNYNYLNKLSATALPHNLQFGGGGGG